MATAASQDIAPAVTVLVGNPSPGSRTAQVAQALARALVGDTETRLFDLAENDNDEALAAVLASKLLVVASPTFKATYTALLKSFLERIPAGALSGTVAIPLMTVGHPAHTLAAEVSLRPLLQELGAVMPTPSVVVVTDADFDAASAIEPHVERCRQALTVARSAFDLVGTP